MKDNTVAVILAGGRGRRMDALCEVRPKPVLPFAGGNRVVDYALSNCVNSKLGRIVVLTDYQRSSMRTYLASWEDAGARTSLEILEPRFGSYRGTADAVHQNLDMVMRSRPELVLVLAADHVYKMDYRKMLAYHQKMGADVTVGVVPVPIEEASRFGIAVTNADGRIIEFQEKPGVPRNNLASMGIYVFSADVLQKRLDEDAVESRSLHDFGHAVIPQMVALDQVFAFRFDGYWQDIGTIEAYYEANMRHLAGEGVVSCKGTWPVFTRQEIEVRPRIAPSSDVVRSVIGPGCVIKGRVENSILSAGVRVEENAVVKDSIVMENTSVGRHCVVDCAILDERVSVGDFSYVGFGGNSALTKKVTVVGRAACIPPHIAVGRGCTISPDASPGFFPGATIPPGTQVRPPGETDGELPEKAAIPQGS